MMIDALARMRLAQVPSDPVMRNDPICAIPHAIFDR